MKRLLFFSNYLCSLVLLSVVCYSCCNNVATVSIVGTGDLGFLSEQDGVKMVRDTLKGESFEIILPLAVDVPDGPFCDEEQGNRLVESSFKLSSDQVIVYDGNIIPAGTDFGDNTDLSVTVSNQSCEIIFQKIFMVKAFFTEGDHVFTVQLKTDDGLDLESSGTINFKF